MTRITTDAAAKQLPELLAAVLAGESVELLHEGKPVIRLVAITESSKHIDFGPLESDPCVGMWADREDMQDGAEWVSTLREAEWKRP